MDTPADTTFPEMPSDLAEVTARWATLPEALRAGIMAMIRAAGVKP